MMLLGRLMFRFLRFLMIDDRSQVPVPERSIWLRPADQFEKKPKLAGEAHSAEHLGLGSEDAGEQKQAFEQLLFVVERDREQPGPERDPVR